MDDIGIIMDTIRLELTSIMSNDPDYYENYKIVLSNEQQFVNSQDREKNTIYIVVKVLSAQITFGQRVVPITINAVSELNKIEVCQRLLNEFANQYNLKNDSIEDGDVVHFTTQTYTTPAVSSNFNDVYSGYVSLFYMSGTFLISENANVYTLEYNDEKIDTITNSFSFDVQNDTQATFSSNDFTKSNPMIGTLVVSFTCYFVSDGICKDLLVMLNNKNINNSFVLTLKFKGGIEFTRTLRLVNLSVQNNAAELPVASITMTE